MNRDVRPRTSPDKALIKDDGPPADNHGERERTNRSSRRWENRPMAQNELLTPAEVAVMFRVNPKTVTRWARAGKISAVRTLGGHRRFRAGEVRVALASAGEQVEGQ